MNIRLGTVLSAVAVQISFLQLIADEAPAVNSGTPATTAPRRQVDTPAGEESTSDAEQLGGNRKVDEYELMKLFVETYQQIDTSYVREVDRRQLIESAIRGMLGHLDRHSSYIPPSDVRRFNQTTDQEFGGVGVTVNIRDGKLLVISPLSDTPAYRNGIRAGDVIVRVNGELTEDFNIDDAVRRLQGPVGRPVSLTLVSPTSERRVVTLTRQKIIAATVRGDRYNADGTWDYRLEKRPDIGLIRITNFGKYTSSEVRSAIEKLERQNVRGIIIDVRFNPGGLLDSAIEICDMFLETGDIVSIRGRNVAEKKWQAKKAGTLTRVPVAVLVNKYSASASEVLSACLQDNRRAVVIGERSFGKGSVQNVIQMEHGASALKLTTAGYYRPSGQNIDRTAAGPGSDEWGVRPDSGFEIQLTQEDWTVWYAAREARDILRQVGQNDPLQEVPDQHLAAAVVYLTKAAQNSASTAAGGD